MKKFYAILTLNFALFLAASCFVSMRLDTKHAAWKGENLLYIPRGEVLKHFVFGFNQVVADLLWIKTITYFGGHSVSDRQTPWLGNLLDAITTLDPQWDYPFHFAAVILSAQPGMVDQANHLVAKGMEIHPKIWQFPFYLGYNFFQIKKDSRCGAIYIFKASTYEKSPDYLKPLAARLSNAGDTPENHLEMCNRLLALTKDPKVQKEITRRCKEDLSKDFKKFKSQFNETKSGVGGPCL